VSKERGSGYGVRLAKDVMITRADYPWLRYLGINQADARWRRKKIHPVSMILLFSGQSLKSVAACSAEFRQSRRRSTNTAATAISVY